MTHYLDYAATSPIRPAALEAWTRAQHELSLHPGNPAALHSGGRRAKRMLEDAREKIGHALGAQRAEVVFVSGATESDALGVLGAARACRARSLERSRVLLSRVEHDAVAEQESRLAADGFTVCHIPLGADGLSLIDPSTLQMLTPHLALASMCYVCSEIGTIQPLDALVEALGGEGSSARTGERPLIHTDATQALGLLDLNFASLNVDLLSLGGHKIGAPVGVGVLLVKRGTPLLSDRVGGGHERGVRSGTPDVAGACALAAVLEETVKERAQWRHHAGHLRELILTRLPMIESEIGAPVRPSVRAEDAIASIIHLSLPTCHPEAVLMTMDSAGVSVSAGSACHAGVTRPSQIRLAMGASEAEALGVLRVSTGPTTSEEDVLAFLRALPGAIRAGRSLDMHDREVGK